VRVGEETTDPSKLPPGSVAIAPHGGDWFDVVWVVWPDGTSGESLDHRRRQPQGPHHRAFAWSSGPWVVLSKNLSEEECDYVADGDSFIEQKRRAVTLPSFKPLQTRKRRWANNMSNYAEILRRAAHDPKFRRDVIAFLRKRAWEELPLEELPSGPQRLVDFLVSKLGLQVQEVGQISGGKYQIEFSPQRTILTHGILRELIKFPGFLQITVDEKAVTSSMAPTTGVSSGHGLLSVSRDELKNWLQVAPSSSALATQTFRVRMGI